MVCDERRAIKILRWCVFLGLLVIGGELLFYDHHYDFGASRSAAVIVGCILAGTLSTVLSGYLALTTTYPQCLGRIASSIPCANESGSSRGRTPLWVNCCLLLACYTATDMSYTLGIAFEAVYVLIVFNVAASICVISQVLRGLVFSGTGGSREPEDSRDSSSDEEEYEEDSLEAQQTTLLYVSHICGGVWTAIIVQIATEPQQRNHFWLCKIGAIVAIPLIMGLVMKVFAHEVFAEVSIRYAGVVERAYDSPFRSLRRALGQRDGLSAAIAASIIITPALAAALSALLSVLAVEFMAVRHGDHGHLLSLQASICISTGTCFCFVLPAAQRSIHQRTASLRDRLRNSLKLYKSWAVKQARLIVSFVRPSSNSLANQLEQIILREQPQTKPTNAASILRGNKIARTLCLVVLLAVWSILMGSLTSNRNTVEAAPSWSMDTVHLDTRSVDVWAAYEAISNEWEKARLILQRRHQLISRVRGVRRKAWDSYAAMLDALSLLARSAPRHSSLLQPQLLAVGFEQAAQNGNSRVFERKELHLAHALASTVSNSKQAFVWCGHFGLFPLTVTSSDQDSLSPWVDCQQAMHVILNGSKATHVRQDPLPSYYATRKSMLSRLQCFAQSFGLQTPLQWDTSRCSHAEQLAVLPVSEYTRVFPLTLALPQDTSVALALLDQSPVSALMNHIETTLGAEGGGRACETCPVEGLPGKSGAGLYIELRNRLQKAQNSAEGNQLQMAWSSGFVLKSTMHSDGQLAQEWHKRAQERLHVRPVIHANHKAVANSTAILTQRLRSRISNMRSRSRLRGAAGRSFPRNATRSSRVRARPGHHLSPSPSFRKLLTSGAVSGHKARTTQLRPFYDVLQAKVDDLKLPSGRAFGVSLNAVVLLKPLRVYIHQGGVVVSVSASPNHPLRHCSLNSHAGSLHECQSDDATIAPGTMSAQEMLSTVAKQQHSSTLKVWNQLASQSTKAVLAVAQYLNAQKHFKYTDFALVGDNLPPFFGEASQFMAQTRGELLSQSFQLDLVFDRQGHPWVVDMQPDHDQLLLSKNELLSSSSAARRIEFFTQQFLLLGPNSKSVTRILEPLKAEICRQAANQSDFLEHSAELYFGGQHELRRFLEQASASYQTAVAAGRQAAVEIRLRQVFGQIFAFHLQRKPLNGTQPGAVCLPDDDQYVERFLREHLALTSQAWFRAFPVADISEAPRPPHSKARPGPHPPALGTSGLRFPSDCGKVTRAEAYQADRDYTREMQPLLRSVKRVGDRPSTLYHATLHALQLRYEWYRRWVSKPDQNDDAAQPSDTLLWLAKEWFQW